MAKEVNAIYTANVKIAFDYIKKEGQDPKRFSILSERIDYIMIDYKYENQNILPVIVISLKMNPSLYDKLLSTYDTSKIYFKLTKKDTQSGTSVATTVVNDEFSYVVSNHEQNNARELNSEGTNSDSYISTTIGLISTTMTEMLRESFNGVYHNTNVESLLFATALKGIPKKKLIMTPIKYNKNIDSLLIKPLNNRYKMIEAIFDEEAFYDTNFTFFFDFDGKTYLVDKSGEPVSKDGLPDKIYFHITKKIDSSSMVPGSTIKNNSYHIYVNAVNSVMNINDSIEQIADTIVSFDHKHDKVQELSITGKKKSSTSNKNIYLKSDNAAVFKNEMNNSTVTLELFKQNLDASIITPNRGFYVTFENEYSKYNGKYILSYKQEIYVQTQGKEFTQTCKVGLKRVNAIERANSDKDTAVSVRHDIYNTKATKTSSADLKAISKNTSVTANNRTKS